MSKGLLSEIVVLKFDRTERAFLYFFRNNDTQNLFLKLLTVASVPSSHYYDISFGLTGTLVKDDPIW